MKGDLEWFSSIMQEKLAKNSWKGTWYTCSKQYLSMRLTQERKELQKAIAKGNVDEIVNEAADVANFAMMIAAVYKWRK